MADAVVRTTEWGPMGGLAWLALLVVGVFVATPRGQKKLDAGRFVLVVKIGLAVLWTAIIVHVAHQAATEPLDHWWTLRHWQPRST